MIKIGIITFQRAHNYGAVLQAYALMTTLKNMGHDVELIDYWPKYRKGHYSLFSSQDSPEFGKVGPAAYIKHIIRRTLNFPARYKKYSRFNTFIKHRLKVGSASYHSGPDTPDKYDVIICGSDQIWRYNFKGNNGFDAVYFAKYPQNTKAIKVAYAASMGDKDLDETGKRELSKLIENLDHVSVREEALLELVIPMTPKAPVKVLDPVFFLSEGEWRNLIKPNTRKRKYLLFYQLLQNKKAAALAKKLAKEKGLELIEIRGIDRNTHPFESKSLHLSAGPIDFISLIAHADYVVSTSYHGVVFSIVFQKPFSALGFKNNSYRIRSLFQSFGLDQGLAEKKAEIHGDAIDYNTVNLRLKELIKTSRSFLEHSIHMAKQKKKALSEKAA